MLLIVPTLVNIMFKIHLVIGGSLFVFVQNSTLSSLATQRDAVEDTLERTQFLARKY